MTKDRQIIFDKFGGRCSYCGDKSQKGWHVDHAEPIERKMKSCPAGWFHRVTGEPMPKELNKLSEEEFEKYFKEYEHKPSKLIPDGCHKPENDVIENKMPACASCNINKHSMNIEEFRRSIERFVASLNKQGTQYKIAKRYGLIKETKKKVVFCFEKFNNEKTKTQREGVDMANL